MGHFYVINRVGLSEIRDFLAKNHIYGEDYFDNTMLLCWAREANFQLSENNPASIELKSWESINGMTQEYTVSDNGIDAIELCIEV